MCAVCSVLPCDHIKGLNKLHVAGLRHNIYSCPLSLLAAVVRMCQGLIVLMSPLLKLQSAAQVSPAPIKSLTLTTLTPTQSVHDGNTRLCSGRCPDAPSTRGGLRARCSACTTNYNNITTAANNRSAGRIAVLIGGFNILCCAFYRIIPGYYEYCIIRQTQLPIFTFFSILYTKDCQRCNYW